MNLTPLLLSTFSVVSAISANELQLDPIIVSASAENSGSSASFSLDPIAPASSSLTLADLLISEGLGTKAKI